MDTIKLLLVIWVFITGLMLVIYIPCYLYVGKKESKRQNERYWSNKTKLDEIEFNFEDHNEEFWRNEDDW